MTVTVTAPLFDLARVLHNAAIFAAGKDGDRELQVIRLRIEASAEAGPEGKPKPKVSAIGLDLHRVGTDWLITDEPCAPPPAEPADFQLWASEVLDVTKMLRKHPRPKIEEGEPVPTVVLSCQEDRVTFEVAGDTTTFILGTFTETLFPVVGEDRLLRHKPDMLDRIIFNPRHLADYRKVLLADARTVGSRGVRLGFGAPGKPVYVHIGETFEGLLTVQSPRTQPDGSIVQPGAVVSL